MLLEFVAKYLILGLIVPVGILGLLGNFQFSLKSFIALSITWFVTIMIKEITNQPRPYIRLGRKSPLDDPPTDKSFPSGHTAASMTMAVSLLFVSLFGGVVAIIIAITVGISRIVAHVHTWYDVLIGGLLGGLIAYLVHMLI